MEFNTGKCKVLHLWKNNPHALVYQYTELKSSLAENYLEALVNTKLANLMALAAKKAKISLAPLGVFPAGQGKDPQSIVFSLGLPGTRH